uniref:Ig-like domain-containing protein n=1 Tax=Spermophilus dauricus TaxID=99837 RepID=A0A8C9QKS8_SPEDA
LAWNTDNCSRSFSQPVLTQPPSASASLGQTAKLTCTLSSGYSSYWVVWFQQSPGKSPRFVMRVGISGIEGSKGDGIPDRFSGSGSGLDRYLTIQNIQEEDENVYHCGAPHGSGSSYV